MSTARIATAPISWGISEVPGWGYQFPADRVLEEMRQLDFDATEMGPDGFLPPAPEDKAARLAQYNLAAVGSFVPVVVHDREVDPLPRIERELADYAAAGADVLILCAVTGNEGYNQTREPLDDAGWATLFANLDRIAKLAETVEVTAVLHPHVGSMVETADDVDAVLQGSSIPLCFDTGHLMIGGIDPVRFAAEHADRIAHTHLKDVSAEGIQRVKAGELSYFDAISQDVLYRPLGAGDVDVKAIISSLLGAGYTGWFVLEQDKVVKNEPAPGTGPIDDARASVSYLRGALDEIAERA